jgi:hypothetical protein
LYRSVRVAGNEMGDAVIQHVKRKDDGFPYRRSPHACFLLPGASVAEFWGR